METKYGIVGCGYISQLYLTGFKKLGALVVHVADVDVERAKAYAKEFGAKASADFHAVVQDSDVTTVVVLTHTKFHKDICLAAIQAGKNVICEKTLALSSDDGAEIARAAKKAGVFFFTAYMKRLFPAVQKAKSLLSSLGTIYSVYARSYQFWGNLYNPPADFSGELWLKNYGGGVLKCAGSHILDLIMFFFGRPTSLYGRMDWVENTHLDRNAIAMLEYPKSLTVTFEAAGHCLSRIGFQKNNWDERFEINGTNGRLDLYLPTWNKSSELSAMLVHYDEATQTSTEYCYDAVDTFQAQLEYFHKCLSERKAGHPDAVDGFNVDTLIGAIDESSRKKSPVTIDWKGL
jgi:predicted dehydrogenase